MYCPVSVAYNVISMRLHSVEVWPTAAYADNLGSTHNNR